MYEQALPASSIPQTDAALTPTSAPEAATGRHASAQDAVLGLASLALLGLVSAVSDPAVVRPVVIVLSLPLVAVGTALISVPSLIISAPALGLPWTGEHTVRAVGDGLAAAGRLARATSPLLVFAAATTNAGPLIYLSITLAVGMAGIGHVRHRLATVHEPATLTARMFARGWAVFATLVALRLAWAVAKLATGVTS